MAGAIDVRRTARVSEQPAFLGIWKDWPDQKTAPGRFLPHIVHVAEFLALSPPSATIVYN